MLAVFRRWALTLSFAFAVTWAADIPQQPQTVLTGPYIHQPLYYWQASPVGNTAQLLTLFCRSCQAQTPNVANSAPPKEAAADIPLVAVLRDTLGDNTPENDRLASVWLLTYSSPNIGRQFLSAVPFFFWRTGQGTSSVTARDTKPLFDLTQPQHPVLSEMGRNLLQWTALDPTIMPVRAASRAYRTNGLDYERLHLEEAISYLRAAPVSNDSSALTVSQRDTVIARLELRKRLLGGLVKQSRAARFGEESGYEQERIRSRNWELLRQCAEKTGLLFESIDLAGATGQYGILWFPLDGSFPSTGTSLGPIWKLLNIQDPWTDHRLKAHGLKTWTGPVYTRTLAGSSGSDGGGSGMRLVPLGVYSLNYPKLPLLMVDFRDKLHVRWHEMTQRSINEITAGVIGISHFTNWYYYVGADLYDFVIARHGGAMNQAARLDAYSQFRVKLALDQQLDPRLRQEMQTRVNSLAINPLDAAPAKEMEAAKARYAFLQAQTQEGGRLLERVDKQRRAELAVFGESKKAQATYDLLHTASLGLYTQRVKPQAENLATLDRDRRVAYHLDFLASLADADTQPEVAYDTSRILVSVNALTILLPSVPSPEIRLRAQTVLVRLKSLSQDQSVQSDCSVALASLAPSKQPLLNASIPGVVTSTHSVALASSGLDARK